MADKANTGGDRNGEPTDPVEASVKRALEYRPLFEEYREKVKAENELVNQRMTWFIVLQSFLFISLALLSGSELLNERYKLLVLAYTIVGCASAWANKISVTAAFTALEATHDQWEKLSQKLDPDFHFPALKGGGPEHIGDDGGKALTTVLAPAVILAWLGILGVMLVGHEKKPEGHTSKEAVLEYSGGMQPQNGSSDRTSMTATEWNSDYPVCANQIGFEANDGSEQSIHVLQQWMRDAVDGHA